MSEDGETVKFVRKSHAIDGATSQRLRESQEDHMYLKAFVFSVRCSMRLYDRCEWPLGWP